MLPGSQPTVTESAPTLLPLTPTPACTHTLCAYTLPYAHPRTQSSEPVLEHELHSMGHWLGFSQSVTDKVRYTRSLSLNFSLAREPPLQPPAQHTRGVAKGGRANFSILFYTFSLYVPSTGLYNFLSPLTRVCCVGVHRTCSRCCALFFCFVLPRVSVTSLVALCIPSLALTPISPPCRRKRRARKLGQIPT